MEAVTSMTVPSEDTATSDMAPCEDGTRRAAAGSPADASKGVRRV